jgi:hypothetical protein
VKLLRRLCTLWCTGEPKRFFTLQCFFVARIDLIANLIAMAARTCRAAQFRHSVSEQLCYRAGCNMSVLRGWMFRRSLAWTTTTATTSHMCVALQCGMQVSRCHCVHCSSPPASCILLVCSLMIERRIPDDELIPPTASSLLHLQQQQQQQQVTRVLRSSAGCKSLAAIAAQALASVGSATEQ